MPISKPMHEVKDLTPEQERILMGSLALGLTQQRACQSAGIRHGDFYAWLALGAKEASGPNRDFLARVRKVQGQRLSGLVGRYQQIMEQASSAGLCPHCGKPAGVKDPRLAAKMIEWILTHIGKNKAEFSDKQLIEVSGPKGGELKVQILEQWSAVRTAIMNALQPFPEARAAVVAALAVLNLGSAPAVEPPADDPSTED